MPMASYYIRKIRVDITKYPDHHDKAADRDHPVRTDIRCHKYNQ